jgi:uncharacterized RDD family membrane protein YckC
MSTHDRDEGIHPRRMPAALGQAYDEEADFLAAPVFYDGIRMKRVLAFLIDACVVAALWLAWWFVGLIVSAFALFTIVPLVAAGAVLLPIAYHTYTIAGTRHATFGMRAMNIRVVAWDGYDPTLLQAFLQTVLFYASVAFTNFLILIVSLFSDRGRCLHDMLCGTLVVNDLEGPALVDEDRGYRASSSR